MLCKPFLIFHVIRLNIYMYKTLYFGRADNISLMDALLCLELAFKANFFVNLVWQLLLSEISDV